MSGVEQSPENARLASLVAEHRMNAVVEGPSGNRTRVKCDGASCDFYADGDRYWDVVREHDKHLTAVLGDHLPPITPETDAVLAILRRHTIGAFNGTQVACAAPECRAWMKTDDWHQHLAGLIENLSTPPGQDGPQ